MDNTSFTNDDIAVTSFSTSDTNGISGKAKIEDTYEEIFSKEEIEKNQVKIEMQNSDKPSRRSSTRSRSSATAPYVNMSKEDVIKFSNTSFWNTFRFVSILIFWLIWLAFLVTVIVLSVKTPRCEPFPQPHWWQKGVFYQVYVRSFYDQDNNGIGDVAGIAEKLSILKELGVTGLVLSSIFKSRSNLSDSASEYNGTFDYGYEVEDYLDVDESVGDLESFKKLINETHSAGLKLIIDFVPNHSGLDHPWFKEASQGVPYDHGWNSYVKATEIPNNWTSPFGESSWSQIDPTNDYYLHQLLKTQPDLNLRSNYIQEQLQDVLEFWISLEVDGFRIVGSDLLFENSDFANETYDGNGDVNAHSRTRKQKENFELITRWRSIVEKGEGLRVLMTDGSDPMEYYSRNGCHGSHLPINFQLLNIMPSSSSAKEVRELLKNWFDSIPPSATSFWATGDQDRSRLHTLVGGIHTRAFQLLKFTLPGSVLLYYGEEIDLEDDSDSSNLQLDPLSHTPKNISRMGYRSLMCWTNQTDCGFSNSSGTTPWLKLASDTSNTSNIQFQKEAPTSTWKFVKLLSTLRRDEPALQYGSIHFGKADDEIFYFVREHEGSDRLLIVINMSDKPSTANKDLTKTEDGFNIPSKPVVTLATETGNSDIQKDIEAKGVKSLPSLAPGYGFVARWKYKRSV